MRKTLKITNFLLIFLMVLSLLVVSNIFIDRAEATSNIFFDGIGSCNEDPSYTASIHISWGETGDWGFNYYQVQIKKSYEYYWHNAKGMEVDEYGKIYDRSTTHATITGWYDGSTDYDIQAGELYYIRLIHNDGWGSADSIFHGYPVADETDISLTETTYGNVKITWDNDADYFTDSENNQNFDFDWLNIYRKKGSSGSYRFIKKINSKTTTSHIDRTVEEDTTYYYKVKICNEFDHNDGSNIIYSESEIKSITTSPPEDDQYEENDNSGSAKSMTDGYYTGLKCYDEDWYKVYLTKEDDISINIYFTDSNGDLELKLYGTDASTLLGSSTTASDDESVVKNGVSQDGYYYIKVYGYNDDTNDYYNLDINTVENEIDSITITDPNGEKNWKPGETHNIYWISTGSISNVKIKLYKNGYYDSTISYGTSNDGAYSWSIPTTQTYSSLYKIKIEDTTNSNTYDFSDDYFSIKEEKTISITKPDGGENWKPGTSQYIKWTSTGSISKVKIKLYKNGYYDSTITSSTSNDGIYSWTIPNSQSASDNYKIKIEDTSDNTINDKSQNYFTIEEEPTLELTSPNGGEEWEPGTNHYIEWTSTGDIDDVEIKLYKNGYYHKTIASNVNNDGRYYWQISESLQDSDNYKLKIIMESDSSVYDNSNNYFTIEEFRLTLTSPNGGESWNTGTTHIIKWDKTKSTGNVKIKLYKDGSYNSIIAINTDNDGSYSWTIPSSQTYSEKYKVRITSLSNGYVYDYSDNYFTIGTEPTIEITSPNGGEEWIKGTNHDIKWTSTGSIGNVKLELYKNGYYHKTITSSTSNDETYRWKVPSSQTESEKYKIKISSKSYSSVNDKSDNYFTVGEEKTISITEPNGEETWKPGTSHSIKWTSTGSISNVKIKLYKDGKFDSTITYSTSNDGVFDWSIPSSKSDSNYYKIKIEDTSDNAINDKSQNYFTIEEEKTLQVTSPNGFETWKPGTTHNIKWTSTGSIGKVEIKLYKNGYYSSTIVSSTSDDGIYRWKVPSSQTESEKYKIKISSTTKSTTNDFSNNYFTIEKEKKPTITLIQPNGNENWKIKDNKYIKWTSSDITGDIEIKLYKDGYYYKTISSSEKNDGSYYWKIDKDLSDSNYYKIKVLSSSDSSVYDESDDHFSIKGKEEKKDTEKSTITLTSPNGDETWKTGTKHSINWDSDGDESYVSIKLYRNGYFDSTISSKTSNDGSFSWEIPSTKKISDKYKIKITIASDETIYDESDDHFSIKGKEEKKDTEKSTITLTSPNGGELWNAGSSHYILWDSEEISGYVKIELYKKGEYYKTIKSSTLNDGNYNWNIPTTLSESDYYKIRITSKSNDNVEDSSDKYFSIKKEVSNSNSDDNDGTTETEKRNVPSDKSNEKTSKSYKNDNLADDPIEKKDPGYYGLKTNDEETGKSAVPSIGTFGMIIAISSVVLIIAFVGRRKK